MKAGGFYKIHKTLDHFNIFKTFNALGACFGSMVVIGYYGARSFWGNWGFLIWIVLSLGQLFCIWRIWRILQQELLAFLSHCEWLDEPTGVK